LYDPHMSPTQNDVTTNIADDTEIVDEAPTELELVEEISIDGMCGVY
jgi:mycofactocin precursor